MILPVSPIFGIPPFMKPQPSSSAVPRTIAVFLPNWIGDVVMATPTLRALREKYPSPTRLVGVMRPYVAKVLAGTPWLDQNLFYDRHAGKPELSPRALLKQLKAESPDMAVILSSSWTSAWIAWRSGAKRRIGYARNLRGLLLTDRCHDEYENGKRRILSTVDQYLKLATLAGCGEGERRVELTTLASDEQAAEQVWSNLQLHGRRVVMLNMSAMTGDSRLWPREHVVELARSIVDRTDATVLLLCGPSEKEGVERIERELAHPRVLSMAKQDLGLSVSRAIIRRGTMLVTTDSGPRHIAAAFSVPTVVLYGPTTPLWTWNYSQVEREVSLDMSCRPCERKKCPLAHNLCMRDLRPELVIRAVREMLERTTRRLVA